MAKTTPRPPLPDKLPLLRRLNLFEEMDEKEVEAVSRQLKMTHCAAGSDVYSGKPDRIYLLKQGQVRLYRLAADGTEVTTGILVPGQLFGTTSLFGEPAENDYAQTLADSYICEAGASDFLAIMARHPVLMAKVMMAMAKHVFRLERTVEQLVHESVSMRLADCLVGMVDDGEVVAGGVLLASRTRDELASQVMSTRESVSRTLAQWARAGIIELQGRRILVRDVNKLRRQSSPDTASSAPGHTVKSNGQTR